MKKLPGRAKTNNTITTTTTTITTTITFSFCCTGYFFYIN